MPETFDDLTVLQAIARICRGVTLPGTACEAAPELLLRLELGQLTFDGELQGALVSLKGRGLAISGVDTFDVRPNPCRYVTKNGIEWQIECASDGSIDVRGGDGEGFRTVPTMLYWRPTPTGWIAAEGEVADVATKPHRVPQKNVKETVEGTANARVTRFIAQYLGERKPLEKLTRDGIANALGLAGSTVSGTNSWKETAKMKRQARLGGTLSEQAAEALTHKDWAKLGSLQAQEQRHNRQFSE